MRSPAPTLLAFVLLAAGCLASPQAPATHATPWHRGLDTPRPDFDFSHAIVSDHNHLDPSLHTKSFGMELVGFTDLVPAGVPPDQAGAYDEVAVAGGYAFVANFGPHRGFSIADVRDPAHPRLVGDFYPSAYGPAFALGAGSYWDVSVFPDGNTVVLSAQALANVPTPDRQTQNGGGVFLVNVQDKAHPVLESFTQVTDTDALIKVGVHNANPFQVAGKDYVAVTTANGATYLYEVMGAAPHRTLQFRSKVPGMHDTTVQVHPITNRTYIYGARSGVYITDITDVAHPQQVSFTPDGPNLKSYHQVMPSNVLIDGRHYTISAIETQNDPAPFYILDTTDPTEPKPVGHWMIPGDVKGNHAPYEFSPHNLEFDHGRVYMGHYHAGVWVVDLSNLTNAADPFPIAFYQPHEARTTVPRDVANGYSPSVWNAVRNDEDGLIYCADANSGLYILRFTGPPSPLADAPVFPYNYR
jgi:hypothetical protein